MGTAASFSLLAQVLAALGAALAVHLGFGFVLVASALAPASAAAIALTLPDARSGAGPDAGTETEAITTYLHLLREGVHEVARSPELRRVVIFAGLVLGLGSVDEFLGLVLREADIGNSGVSLWHAAFFLAGVVGSLLARRALRIGNRTIALVAVGWGASVVLASRVSGAATGTALVVFMGLFAFQGVALDARLQHLISSRARATITSVQGFAAEIGALATYATFGLVAGRSSNHAALAVIGTVIVLAAIAFGVSAGSDRWSTRPDG